MTPCIKEIITNLAKKYNTLKQFREEQPKAYHWALKNNLIPIVKKQKTIRLCT
jgi:hypothetical protein